MEEWAGLQERKFAWWQGFRQRHFALQKQAWMKQVLKVSWCCGCDGLSQRQKQRSQWWIKVACGKCIANKFLLKHIHSSVLNVKMQVKLKDVQAAFLINATSLHCFFSFSSVLFSSFCFSVLFWPVYQTLVYPPCCSVGVQSSGVIFLLQKLLICYLTANAPAATVFQCCYIPCQLKISETTKAG